MEAAAVWSGISTGRVASSGRGDRVSGCSSLITTVLLALRDVTYCCCYTFHLLFQESVVAAPAAATGAKKERKKTLNGD